MHCLLDLDIVTAGPPRTRRRRHIDILVTPRQCVAEPQIRSDAKGF